MTSKYTRNTPVYQQSIKYANENGEREQYRESNYANHGCRDRIDELVSTHYSNNRLDVKTILQELRKEFSDERIQYVLANTIQQKPWDGRFSKANRLWSETIDIEPDFDSMGNDRRVYIVVDKSHPGLVDLLISHFRGEI